MFERFRDIVFFIAQPMILYSLVSLVSIFTWTWTHFKNKNVANNQKIIS